ncbi:hypothetical protein TIFTF001_037701 [Ficus carica]|uniref:Terpene synthase metal-binding domain-containing protein n=1 Tax=Ficus carica TaxID=3494 RepID=A0AA88JCE1_FICCA|nr:hypothetical protein TIFTF001_037701 [Ficus carica]
MKETAPHERNKQWIRPPEEKMKLNTDTSSLLFAKDCGICIQIAEVDATRVVEVVNCGDSFVEEGAVINDILELFSVSPQWSCFVICREVNRVARCLAASVFILENEVYGWDEVPRFVAPMHYLKNKFKEINVGIDHQWWWHSDSGLPIKALIPSIQGCLPMWTKGPASYLGMPAEDVLEETKSFHKKDGSYKEFDFARVSQVGLKPSAICVSARAQGTGKVVWSRDLGFKENLEFSRDRLMEKFLWVMGIGFEPHLSKCRIGFIKFVCILTAIDDDYDIYGSLDELESFTHAVKRWDVKAIKGHPFYMKICYLAMLNFGNDLIYAVLKLMAWMFPPSLRKRWFYSGYTPIVEEYLEKAGISIGGHAGAVHACVLGFNRSILVIPHSKT